MITLRGQERWASNVKTKAVLTYRTFCTRLVPIAYHTLINKGLKTVQVFRS